MVFMDGLVVKTHGESAAMRKAAHAIVEAAWNELGFLSYTRSHYEHYDALVDEYADFQLCLVDEARGYPVAVANCVPLKCDANALPPEGWDWVVETAASRKPGEDADMLGALSISVPGIYRSKGYARLMIRELLALADRPDLPCEKVDRVARDVLGDVEAKIARLQSLRKELKRMVESCGHGQVGDCRVIAVLADYTHRGCLTHTH